MWFKQMSKSNSFAVNIKCLSSLNIKLLSLIQIYTDFNEIRQEIEAETERISGINKVFVTSPLQVCKSEIMFVSKYNKDYSF